MPFQQTTTPSGAPPVPAPPAAPVVTGADVGTGQPISLARPTTKAEYRALEAKREELSNQLQSVTRRRDGVAREYNRASDATRPGIEARLKVLDARILDIEQQIAANGRALAAAPLDLAAQEGTVVEPRYGPFSSGQLTGISIVGTVTVLMPLAVAAARAMLIRARQPKLSPEMLEATRRMERMEQAIDAVAVEVERISEGQRFVTQLMAAKEKEAVKLSAGG